MNGGWLAAAAEAHNKEMYSKNRNISTVNDMAARREDSVRMSKALFWDSATEENVHSVQRSILEQRWKRSASQLFCLRDGSIGNQCYVNAGTQHQFFLSEREVEADAARVVALRRSVAHEDDWVGGGGGE